MGFPRGSQPVPAAGGAARAGRADLAHRRPGPGARPAPRGAAPAPQGAASACCSAVPARPRPSGRPCPACTVATRRPPRGRARGLRARRAAAGLVPAQAAQGEGERGPRGRRAGARRRALAGPAPTRPGAPRGAALCAPLAGAPPARRPHSSADVPQPTRRGRMPWRQRAPRWEPAGRSRAGAPAGGAPGRGGRGGHRGRARRRIRRRGRGAPGRGARARAAAGGRAGRLYCARAAAVRARRRRRASHVLPAAAGAGACAGAGAGACAGAGPAGVLCAAAAGGAGRRAGRCAGRPGWPAICAGAPLSSPALLSCASSAGAGGIGLPRAAVWWYTQCAWDLPPTPKTTASCDKWRKSC